MARSIESRVSAIERELRPGEPRYYSVAQLLAMAAHTDEVSEEEATEQAGPPRLLLEEAERQHREVWGAIRANQEHFARRERGQPLAFDEHGRVRGTSQ